MKNRKLRLVFLSLTVVMSFANAAFSSVCSSDLRIFQTLKPQVNWAHHLDEESNVLFGAHNTWDNFTSQTLGGSLPVPTKASVYYRPGCVPIAMGQIMAYLLKHRYNTGDNALDVQAPLSTLDKKYSFSVDFMSQNGLLIPFVDSIKLTRSRMFSVISNDKKYHWNKMPNFYSNGMEVDENGMIIAKNAQAVRDYIAPFLFDLGIAAGVHYKLNPKGETDETTVGFFSFYNGESVIKDFGFEHAAFYDSSVFFFLTFLI